MDKLTLVDKLRLKANISYEEAKKILEDNNWDILDSIVYLESIGKVEKPEISIFYTNEYKEENTFKGEIAQIYTQKEYEYFKEKKSFNGIFETICKVIDTLNNIFINVNRRGKILLKLPLTVIILLLFFAFWIIIPLIIVALFWDIEFLVTTKIIVIPQIDKVNMVFKEASKNAGIIKEKIKKRFN